MMLANHTSIRNLFKIIIDQQKKMRKRQANLHVYRDFPIFKDGLEEFDQAEESVVNLMQEYEAAEKDDYISWGTSEDMRDGGAGGDGSMDYQ